MKPTVSLFHVNIGLNREQYMLKQPRILTVFEILGQGLAVKAWFGRSSEKTKFVSIVRFLIDGIIVI